jgi:hypothetical protein
MNISYLCAVSSCIRILCVFFRVLKSCSPMYGLMNGHATVLKSKALYKHRHWSFFFYCISLNVISFVFSLINCRNWSCWWRIRLSLWQWPCSLHLLQVASMNLQTKWKSFEISPETFLLKTTVIVNKYFGRNSCVMSYRVFVLMWDCAPESGWCHCCMATDDAATLQRWVLC